MKTDLEPHPESEPSEEARFASFRYELESGARRVRFLLLFVLFLVLAIVALTTLKPWLSH